MHQLDPIISDDLLALPASTLYFLRTFRAVAALRSYTHAAQLLHLGQPAVSAQIRALERAYEARLFEVRHRRVYLTAEGDALLAYADRAFNLLRNAPGAVKAAQRGEWGRLVLAASGTIGVYLLPRVLGAFLAAHPEVEVELAIGTTAEVAEQVLAERAPFGFVEAPVTLPGLEVRPIGEDELVLVSSPGHQLVGTPSIAATDLETVPLLRRESGSGTQALVDTALWRLGVKMPTAMTLGSSEALKQAALAGIAVAWLPMSAVARELESGELVAVAVPEVRVRRTLSLILPAGSSLPAAGRALLYTLKLLLDAPKGADLGGPISTSLAAKIRAADPAEQTSI